MVGELNILKEKQNKTKQENLTHLWDLKNKITFKNKKTSPTCET